MRRSRVLLAVSLVSAALAFCYVLALRSWRAIGRRAPGPAHQPEPPPAPHETLRARSIDDVVEVECVPAVDGLVVLIVSDGPRNFLCAALATALLHGLRPAILGWDPPARRSADGGWQAKHTFNYYVGATILLPLHYVERCAAGVDLFLVADRDVVFQSGAKSIVSTFERLTSRSGAEIVFSAENESMPIELSPLYASAPRGAVHRHLNSGLYIGRPGAVRHFLRASAGVPQTPMTTLWRHYLNWELLQKAAPRTEPPPAVFAPGSNAQIRYAGLYVAQQWAAACKQTENGSAASPSSVPSLFLSQRRQPREPRACFRFWHDNTTRCTPAVCDAAAYPLSTPTSLDFELALFDNLFHAGRRMLINHRVASARRNGSLQTHAAVVQFNGPSKVVAEPGWELPFLRSARTAASANNNAEPMRLTPPECLALGIVESPPAASSRRTRRILLEAFSKRVVTFDPLFRRVPHLYLREDEEHFCSLFVSPTKNDWRDACGVDRHA